MDRSEDFPAAGGAARRSLCGSGGKIDEFDFVESKEERRDFFLTRLTRFLSVNAWPMELGSCNAKEKGFSNRV